MYNYPTTIACRRRRTSGASCSSLFVTERSLSNAVEEKSVCKQDGNNSQSDNRARKEQVSCHKNITLFLENTFALQNADRK